VAATPTTAEAAVRAYLEFVQNGTGIGRQRGLVTRAKDPIVKLKALAAVAQADALEAGFVAHAQEFAAAENIPVEAWAKLGVDGEVLSKAGLAVTRPTRPAAKKRPGSKSSTSGRPRSARAEPLGLDAVAAKLPRKPFKVKDLAERIERPSDTTRKYLDQLVKAERVTIVGQDASGRGKPAKIYQRA